MVKINNFFDRLEDRVRHRLSRHPIIYTFIGGVAVVLFWRGVWLTADLFPFLTGPLSILISVAVLLLIGLFVSFFIGDQIIIEGLKQEKKISEKSETEIKEEDIHLHQLKTILETIKQKLEEINGKLS